MFIYISEWKTGFVLWGQSTSDIISNTEGSYHNQSYVRQLLGFLTGLVISPFSTQANSESLTLDLFSASLKPYTCVSMRTSSQQWTSTLYLPFAPQPTGHSAHVHRLLSNWSPWKVCSLNSGSSMRTSLWRSSASTHQRTYTWWSGRHQQRGECRTNWASPCRINFCHFYVSLNRGWWSTRCLASLRYQTSTTAPKETLS